MVRSKFLSPEFRAPAGLEAQPPGTDPDAMKRCARLFKVPATLTCPCPSVFSQIASGPSIENFGIGKPSQLAAKPGPVVEARCDVWMLRAYESFPNCLGLLMQQFGLGVPSLIGKQTGKAIQTDRKRCAMSSGSFLEDTDSAALHGFSLGIAGLKKGKLSQVTQTIRYLGVVWPK